LPRIVGLEHAAAREQLVEHEAHRVDVGPPVDPVAAELLGGHVHQLSLELIAARGGEPVLRLRDAEVEQAWSAVGADQDVLR
jgi:hypothetical protein